MDVSTIASMFLLLFLAYILSMSSLRFKALYNVINFLVLWFIGVNSSFDHFKNDPEYLTRGLARC